MTMLPRHAEDALTIEADAPDLFAFLDDHRNLSAHMERRSWVTMGGTMELYADAGAARSVGSRFGFRGSVLGLPLAVEEAVTLREPPLRKVWETLGSPQLWVIGPYRMGFEIAPQGPTARLRVFIDYALPPAGFTRLLALLFAGYYARWCVDRMLGDARRHFARLARATATPIGAP